MIECNICGRQLPSTEDAIKDGWSPEYYVDDAAVPDGPACGKCWDLKFVNVDPNDGELILTELGKRAIAARKKSGKVLKVESYGYPS